MNYALSSFGRTRRKIFFLFFLSLLLISFVSYSTSSTILSPVGGEESPSFSPPSGGISSKVLSEEENIDSFDVHPESGRWNTTLDDSIEDRVIDSQFEILTVQNETSGSSGYEMNRGTVKSDGKFEWRMKSDGSGNQTEFFRDKIGDEVDFTEGDQEGLARVFGDTFDLSVENGILKMDNFGGTARWAGVGLSVDITEINDLYHTGIVRIKSENDDGNLRFSLRNQAVISLTSTSPLSQEWETFSKTITWIPDTTIIQIFVDHTSAINFIDEIILIDLFKIVGNYDFATHIEGEVEDTWDFEEGDKEGFVRTAGDTSDSFVEDGFFIVNNTGGTAIDTIYSVTGLTIQSDNWNIVEVRINGSENGLRLQLRTTDTGLGLVLATLSTSLQTFRWIRGINLSVGALEETEETAFRFQFLENSGEGNFDGDEEFFVDYALLLGEFNPSDSVIGLMDSDNNPLLNISTHFFGNDSARFEFELLDSTGELSYHFYSDLFDDLNQFIIGKVSFDILRSKLEITLTAENNSRIDKITFPNEFIVDSGLTPPLFSNEIAPVIFVSTHTIDHSWQSLFIDWIKADYKEREWLQIETPASANWLDDSWSGARGTGPIDNFSRWQLIVPLLDVFSGKAIINFQNITAFTAGEVTIDIVLFGIDTTDGDQHEIAKLKVGKNFEVGSVFSGYEMHLNDIIVRQQLIPSIGTAEMSFVFSLSEDRSEFTMKTRFFPNLANESQFVDTVGTLSLSEVSSDLSQEFIIEIAYEIDYTPVTEVVLLLEDFGFVTRDIWSDIVDAVVQPIGNFLSQIFLAIGNFLAGIFRAVGDVLGVVFVVVGNAITAALAVLQTAFETAIGLVETAITTLQTALETAIGLVETAIATLEAALETAIGLVETAIGTLQSAFEDALGLVQDAIEGVFVFLIAALADIFDEAITVILSILSDIVDVIVGIAFLIWDEIGLPDLLALGGELIVLFGQLIEFLISTLAEVIQLATDLAWVVLVVWWIWAIPIQWARTNFDPISGIGNFIEVFFYDIFPWNILGFHAYIPQGVVFTLWLILLLPGDFALFTAMS